MHRFVLALAFVILTVASASATTHRHHHAIHHAAAVYDRGTVVAHPQGCAWVRFCGCGSCSALGISPARCAALNLLRAANWGRLPSAAPGPGMAAWRYGKHGIGHVFIIREVLSDRVVLAYDPNSGGHLTRIRKVSLNGYSVVNPSGLI